jgi:hypothetical protein
MTGTDTDFERAASLGRIFRGMREELVSIEKTYLDKSKPTAKDFLQAALESLMVIGDSLKGARTVEPNAIQGDTLPAPLDRLMFELSDPKRGETGTASPLLTPGNVPGEGRRPKGKSSLHLWFASAQSLAIVIYDALIEFGRPADRAAKEVAKCFQVRGVKINGKPVTAETIREWSNERGRDKTKLPKLVTKQLAELDKLIEELRNWEYVKPVAWDYVETGFYLKTLRRMTYEAFCIPSDDDRANMLLDWLRNFIRTTACD